MRQVGMQCPLVRDCLLWQLCHLRPCPSHPPFLPPAAGLMRPRTAYNIFCTASADKLKADNNRAMLTMAGGWVGGWGLGTCGSV